MAVICISAATRSFATTAKFNFVAATLGLFKSFPSTSGNCGDEYHRVITYPISPITEGYPGDSGIVIY